MDAKQIKHIRRRLSIEYENLIKSIHRNRTSAEEIKLENTEDEPIWPPSTAKEISSITCTKAISRV